jgi:anti-anti-sigma regulatory factor
MAQASLANGRWIFDVERGPDWLFVRPRRHGLAADAAGFAEQVWALLEQHLTHRLVLELGEVGQLDSRLVGQLSWLYKRIHAHEGIMRVCELSASNEEVLRASRLEGHFPRYRNREDAVLCHAHPKQPR